MDSLSRPVSAEAQRAADDAERQTIVRYWHQVHMARVVMKAELKARRAAESHFIPWHWA